MTFFNDSNQHHVNNFFFLASKRRGVSAYASPSFSYFPISILFIPLINDAQEKNWIELDSIIFSIGQH